MRVPVLNGNGDEQVVIVQGEETATDGSGTLAAAVAQELLAANADRSGWFIQNQSNQNPMWVNELGADAVAVVGAGSFCIGPGQTFPPYGYPLSVAAVSIIGTAGDAFFCREW